MKKLLMGVCVLALGTGVLAGCTERSDRVGGTDRTTSPSASPDLRPSDPARPTTPPPSSAPSSTPSTDPGSPTRSSK
jgi:hypothetical protein